METRNLGVRDNGSLEQDSERALGAALDRFEDRVTRVRIRLLSTGAHESVCRVRVWCGHGPTLVVAAHAASTREAVHAAADTLNQALRRRWSTQRARRRETYPIHLQNERKDL